MNLALPAADLLRQQARWLAPARSRLFRRISIAQRKSVLDCGAGFGTVTHEMARRCAGHVIALDNDIISLREIYNGINTYNVAGDISKLPFVDSSFDLVFSQFTLLWVASLNNALENIWRVLTTGGMFLAIEPDYGGMIEYPNTIDTQDIWLTALRRAGADPNVGRRLPGLLQRQKFRVQINLLEKLERPSSTRFEFLRELNLTDVESKKLTSAEAASKVIDGWEQVAHLPVFLIAAEKTTA